MLASISTGDRSVFKSKWIAVLQSVIPAEENPLHMNTAAGRKHERVNKNHEPL